MSEVMLLIAFLIGCCVGIAPWHWLAKKNERLARDIHRHMMELDAKDPRP